MKRFMLIENAVVNCEDITDYRLLGTELFCGKEEFEPDDYQPAFEAVISFINREKGQKELVVGTLFYLLPCFLSELRNYLGDKVELIPLYALTESGNLREIYDHHIVETTINGSGELSCKVIPDNLLERMRSNPQMAPYVRDNGLETIKTMNEILNNFISGAKSKEEVEIYYFPDYGNIVKGKEGYAVFSPFGSLKLYDEFLSGIINMEKAGTIQASPMMCHPEFSVSFASHTESFNTACAAWMLIEKDHSLQFERRQGNVTRSAQLILPSAKIHSTALQVKPLGLEFTKCYFHAESDIFGHLHIKVEMLDETDFFKLMQFS